MDVEVAWLCFLFPLIGALLSPIFSKFHPRLRDYGAVFFSLLAALVSLSFIPYLFHPSKLPMETSFLWLASPFELRVGVLIDPLSIVMSNVVAVISFIIMVYSIGYMKGNLSLTRYWMWMNLFIGSMLLLVLSNNLLFIFIGWKMVGLCSYGLIGFYFRDEKEYWIGGPPPAEYCTPSHAALKALVVTSIGDLFMLGGILIIFSYSKTLNLLSLYETSAIWIPELAKSPEIMVLAILLFLAGPLGKSAQFPLLEWLPEAMAGPAPVSALIHAATMVKSGVYLVARFFPMFYYGYWVAGCEEAHYFFILTAWIGVFTSFLAATQGMVSTELKKALAYSTISQIGYMMLALGVAGFSPSIAVGGLTSGTSHLISHALFKACLFLCAGSVIHAAHSIYMNGMGSMRRHMPLTWIFMSIAALSLMGVPPLSGFWSKDAILISCMQAHDYPLFFFALITVVLTAFYTTRFIGMVFYGKKSEHLKHIERKGLRLSEAHWTMVGSCGVLAMIILLLSFFSPSLKDLLGEGHQEMMVKILHLPVESLEHSFMAHFLVPLLSTLCVGFGMLPAYLLYISGKTDRTALFERRPMLKRLYRFFGERWYLNRLYYRIVVGGVTRLFTSTPRCIEDPLDKLFHQLIPSIPEGLYRMGGLMMEYPHKQKPVEGRSVDVPTVGITLGFTLGLALIIIALYLIVILILGWFLGS